VSLEPVPDLRARPIVPATTLPSDHPSAPPQPCAACGSELDPLRAPCALAFEDGVRLLCSEECKQNYRSGERVRRRPNVMVEAAPAETARAALVAGSPREEAGVIALEARPTSANAAVGTQLNRDPFDRATVAWVWIGAATIGTAATLSCFPGNETAFGSALLTSLAALAALRLMSPSIPAVGVIAWLLGPLGVIGTSIAAYQASTHGEVGFELFGAVLAATVMVARGLFDAHARAPVELTLQSLLGSLPSHVHVPAHGLSPSGEPAADAVETAKIRVGEEIIARRGELLGVDGIVQAGEATVVPYPGAGRGVARIPGDAVLAGALVLEGNLRVLASRVGDDRAIARLARIGSTGRDSAKALRLVQRLTPWAASTILLGCIGLCLLERTRGLGLPLSAASAVLLAAPLLAIHRAAQWPLFGAATTAGARGILFRSGAALDVAGHVRVVAMAPHRTLTEGKPEVVDVHLLGEDKLDPLLGLIAGAELLAGDHPIGRALVALAHKRGVSPLEMHRALAVPGRGLTSTGPDGEEIVIGSRRLLLDQGVSVAVADAFAARAEAAGRTAVFASVSGRVRAVFALQDQLRQGSRAAVQRLFDLGLEVALLTGDQRGPVETLAAGLDIAHIKCELLPDERAAEVRSLREGGGLIAVIGYPTDDAAALAAADVPIALGAAGGASGDNAIAILGEDLRDAASALWIARATRAQSFGAQRMAGLVFIAIVAAAASDMLRPGVAALAALLVDAYGINAGARLLRRVGRRLPAGS
jgi:cation transport ATPase